MADDGVTACVVWAPVARGRHGMTRVQCDRLMESMQPRLPDSGVARRGMGEGSTQCRRAHRGPAPGTNASRYNSMHSFGR